MGCWNETCGLTNLPIRWGEPVVAIVLQKPENPPMHEIQCLYPDDCWAPIGFPLFGTYDDYGNLENVRTHPWNQELLHIADTPEEDAHNMQNTHFDEPVMFLHEKIYRDVIEHLGKRPVNGKTYRECLKERMLKSLNGKRSPFSWESPMSYGMYTNKRAFQFMLEKYDACTDDAEKQAAVELAVDCQLFYYALSLLRKGYRTISGTGRQSMETALQVLVARFTIEHAQNMFMHDDPPEFLENGYEEPVYCF